MIGALCVAGALLAGLLVMVIWLWRDLENLETRFRLNQWSDAVNFDHRLEQTLGVVDRTVTSTAEAIGKAVQTAQFAPVDPPQPRREQTLEDLLDPDIAEGTIDTSDPTDAAVWLRRDRVDAAPLEGNDPFGIPGLKVRKL